MMVERDLAKPKHIALKVELATLRDSMYLNSDVLANVINWKHRACVCVCAFWYIVCVKAAKKNGRCRRLCSLSGFVYASCIRQGDGRSRDNSSCTKILSVAAAIVVIVVVSAVFSLFTHGHRFGFCLFVNWFNYIPIVVHHLYVTT